MNPLGLYLEITMAGEAGKGSTQRSSAVPKHVVDTNWDNIFGKKSDNGAEETEVYEDGESPQE